MIGEVAGLSCGAAWSIISMVMRSASTRASPVAVNGLRCTFAALSLALALLVSGRLQDVARLPASLVLAIVFSGILGQAIGDALFVGSAKMIGASRALPLSSISPLFTLALAAVFLGEQVSLLAAGGAVLVISGTFLLAFPYGPLRRALSLPSHDEWGGMLLAFAAACCYTTSTIVLRWGLVEVDLFAANLLRLTTASLLLMGVEVAHNGVRVPIGLSRRSLAILVATGAMSAFSSSMYLTSVYYAGAAKAAILTSTSPLFGLPLSLVFLREKINSRIVSGTLLSVVGIWLVLWR